jgi:hypothetical protein
MKLSNKIKAMLIAILLVAIVPSGLGADAASKNAYQTKWGTYSDKLFRGDGDDIVDLKNSIRYGIVVGYYAGDSNFIVNSLDSRGESIDLLFNEIGYTKGAVTFGFGYSSAKAKSFEVQADGPWTLTIREMNKASAFKSSGSGFAVMKYSSSTKRFRIRHSGDSNFIVKEYCTNGRDELVINEIGNYSGKKQIYGGSCIIEIQADGDWSFSK